MGVSRHDTLSRGMNNEVDREVGRQPVYRDEERERSPLHSLPPGHFSLVSITPKWNEM